MAQADATVVLLQCASHISGQFLSVSSEKNLLQINLGHSVAFGSEEGQLQLTQKSLKLSKELSLDLVVKHLLLCWCLSY